MASLAQLVTQLAVTPCSSLDLSEVKSRGELRVVVTAGRPELFNWRRAAHPGLERTTFEGFAESLRVELAIVLARSRAALAPAVLLGKADLAAGGIEVTPGRLAFSAEVLPDTYVVVTRRPHDPQQKARHAPQAVATAAEAVSLTCVAPGGPNRCGRRPRWCRGRRLCEARDAKVGRMTRFPSDLARSAA